MRQVHHIEAVTVCVGYADFLLETAKFNRGLFEEWIVVTAPDDDETREACRKYNLRVVLSEDARRHAHPTKKGELQQNPFNKGRLIERGLQHTSAHGWRLHLDADIAIPNQFRLQLESADLDEDSVYGVDRVMVKSWDRWQQLLKTGYMHTTHYDYHCRNQVCPPGFELGWRWSHPKMGYVPIGFFQLFHSSQDEWKGIRIKPYPSTHSTACRSDVQHGLQWDRSKRALLPEIVVVHLDSEDSPLGANWGGRTSKRFEAPKDRGSL